MTREIQKIAQDIVEAAGKVLKTVDTVFDIAQQAVIESMIPGQEQGRTLDLTREVDPKDPKGDKLN